jgi:hypothetical protein
MSPPLKQQSIQEFIFLNLNIHGFVVSRVQAIMILEFNQSEKNEWRLYEVEEYIWYRVTEMFVSNLTFVFVIDLTFR